MGILSTLTFGTRRPLRVAAYCRVSTEEETQNESYESQRAFFDKEIREHPDWNMTAIYGDRAKSGTSVERRLGFKRMIKHAEAGCIDYIITKSITRFYRSTTDIILTLRKLKALGVGVYFMEQGIDTMSDVGQIIIETLATISEMESVSISQNIKQTMDSMNEKGAPVRRSSYGYKRDGVDWTVVPREALRIKLAFLMTAEGYSFAETAARLNQFESRDRTGRENQAAHYEKQITTNPEWELAGIYGEKVSGTHAENCDEFQRLIADVLDGKIDLILCKSVSRWARNVVDGLNSIKLLTGRGVHIYFEQEGIDTRTPGILLQLNLAASVAQSESESISENLKWNYKQKTAQGKFYASKNKYYGYDTKGDEFNENEDGEWVRFIFDSYVEGVGITEIARLLNEAGVTSQSGKHWNTTSVRCILKNEVYVGDVIFRKTPSRKVITGEIDEDWKPKYVKNHHVGIVCRETWDAAKEKMVASRRVKTTTV